MARSTPSRGRFDPKTRPTYRWTRRTSCWFPDVNDIGRELDKGYKDGTTPTSGDAYVAGFSLAGLFDCKRAEAQVSHKDLAATISGMDSPGRLGVQDSDQAQAAVRYNRDQAAEQSFYAPKKNGGAPP